MTTLQLADNIFPSLGLQDTVATALQLMSEFKTGYLPVISEEKFLGLLAEEDLDESNDEDTLEIFQANFIPAAVNANQYFLKAAAIYNLYQSSVIPVINDSNELAGTISATALIGAMGNFCGSSEVGAMIVLEMERSRFAISEINSIIESDGAIILHLNVAPHPLPDFLEISIQINKKEVSTIIATFERYEYSVSFYSGEELFENELTTNYNNLMNYLQI